MAEFMLSEDDETESGRSGAKRSDAVVGQGGCRSSSEAKSGVKGQFGLTDLDSRARL